MLEWLFIYCIHFMNGEHIRYVRHICTLNGMSTSFGELMSGVLAFHDSRVIIV